MTGAQNRRAAERRGRRAETLAAWVLRLKGYRILARGWRTRATGEIDIVARRGRLVAFVEVKARARVGAAAHALSPAPQARIARTAEAFMQRHPRLGGCSWRFDAILVRPGRWPNHIRDAWRVG
ncbi:MAG: YraN family protein [Alphaproteobacteria bacterium]|nr:YraN family protein [Alphaproteobacteria bacterium]